MDLYSTAPGFTTVPQQKFHFRSLERLKVKNNPFLRKRYSHRRGLFNPRFSRTRLNSTKSLSRKSPSFGRFSTRRVFCRPTVGPALELPVKKKPALIVKIAQPLPADDSD